MQKVVGSNPISRLGKPIAMGFLRLRLDTLPRRAAAGGAIAVVVALCYIARPWIHGLVMLFVQYPLVTWIPVVLGALAGLAVFAAARGFGKRRGGRPDFEDGANAGMWTFTAVSVCLWTLFMVLLPGWQGHATFTATDYVEGASLPSTTQPRLLPKDAAQRYGNRDDMRNAHVVVDPGPNSLVWSAEKATGLFHSHSQGIGIQPLDRIDGTLEERHDRFQPAVSKWGRGSLAWRAYKRHYFTRLKDRVIVPLPSGAAVALTPYVKYKGFPVRRPVLAGVYVLHQDGRLEDLTPTQAAARPELADSGRIFPEDLARDIAEAYGYRMGAGIFLPGDRTKVKDASGNPQPYLTNLGDGLIKWVTVAGSQNDENRISALFLTDATTGRTAVWRPPKGADLLSNHGAARLARGLPLKWTKRVCCDGDGNDYRTELRVVTEPRPVFAKGRFYYLVSIVPDPDYLKTREPVDRTVLIDAQTRAIVKVYDHADPESDDRLRGFLNGERDTP
jgi:hypothetical protein